MLSNTFQQVSSRSRLLMGVVYREVELPDVVAILRKKGYGQVMSRQYGLALNRATGKKFQSGGDVRETVGGVGHDQLKQILRHADSAEQAAIHIENAILGNDMLPVDSVKAQQAPGLSVEVVEKLITARVGNEVAKCLSPIMDQIISMQRDMKESMNRLSSAPTPEKKKIGRPKGSKNKVKEEDVHISQLGPRSSDIPPDAV